MKQIHNVRIGCTVVVTVLVLSIFFSSCSNDEPTMPSADGIITFTTPTEIGEATSRVTYKQEEGTNPGDTRIKVAWEPHDVVGLLDNKNNVLAKFEAIDVNGSKATFKCIEVDESIDFENVTGTLQYMPSAQDGDGYTQEANASTAHLVYANNIVATLGDENLKNNPKLIFKNNTAIFRVIIPSSYNITEGSTLRIFGPSNWNGSDGTKGVKLKIGFTKNDNEPYTLYVAVPKGQVNMVLGIGILNTNNSPLYEYRRFMKKNYEPGVEYTADLRTYKSNVTLVESKYDTLHGFVDLGLPSGTLWATMNIGATDFVGEGSYGDYYQWGTTSDKDQPSKIYVSVNDIVSNKVQNLATKEDAAYDSWGPNWCMPTEDQCKELIENCTWNWCEYLNCYVVYKTSDENNEDRPLLLLPASGYKDNSGSLYGEGSIVDYWTSTASPNGNVYSMTNFYAEPNSSTPTIHSKIVEGSSSPDNAYPIRPVLKSTTK